MAVKTPPSTPPPPHPLPTQPADGSDQKSAGRDDESVPGQRLQPLAGDGTNVVDDGEHDDNGDVVGQARRHRHIDGYAVELLDEVAAILGCRVEYYVVGGETRRHPQQHGGGGTVAARSRSSITNMNRPVNYHQHHRTNYGTWSRLVQELTGEVFDIYSTTGNRSTGPYTAGMQLAYGQLSVLMLAGRGR